MRQAAAALLGLLASALAVITLGAYAFSAGALLWGVLAVFA